MYSILDVSDELRSIVFQTLEEAQRLNERFSLRAYASKLDVPASFLSEFLSGKRVLSPERATKIINKLSLKSGKRLELLSKLNLNRPLERTQISSEHYYVVSDPMYYSLLCLVETKNFSLDYNAIGRKLGTTEMSVKNYMAKLLELGFISVNEDGEFFLSTPHLITTDGIPNDCLKERHRANLSNAISAIDGIEIEEKFFGFETLAINPSDLAKFRKLANDFLDQVVTLSNANLDKEEVYEFNINFYPKTKPINKTINEKNEVRYVH